MMRLDQLISPAYRQLQVDLHAGPKAYGERGDKWAGIVLQLAIDYQASSILDYGCGEGALAKALRSQPLNGLRIAEYDPGVPGKDQMPSFADLVVVTDVLEHVERDRLKTVIKHLKGLARKAVFCVIALKPSAHLLADGRNAHLIVDSKDDWVMRLRAAGFVLRNPPTVVRKIEGEWSIVLIP